MTEGETVLSAQVVLRPPGGALSGHEAITSANVADYLPDPDAADTVASWFRAEGFEVRDRVGLGFAIVAPQATFERWFGPIQVSGQAWNREAAAAGGGLGLSPSRIPPEVARAVQAIEFTPPPDFGPTDY
jgi:hypothetical protein